MPMQEWPKEKDSWFVVSVIRCVRFFFQIVIIRQTALTVMTDFFLVFEYYILVECTQVKTRMQRFFCKTSWIVWTRWQAEKWWNFFLVQQTDRYATYYATTLKNSQQVCVSYDPGLNWSGGMRLASRLEDCVVKVDPGQGISEKYLSIISDEVEVSVSWVAYLTYEMSHHRQQQQHFSCVAIKNSSRTL